MGATASTSKTTDLGVTREISARRIGLFILFLVATLTIFVLGNPYYSLWPTNRNADYNALISVFFLAITGLVYRNERTRKYWRVYFAFFVAAFANWTLGQNLIQFPGDTGDTAQGLAWDKLAQFLKVVPPILALVLAAGDGLGSVYLKRGKVKVWLPIGLGSFVVFTVSGLIVDASQGTTLESMLAVLPLWLMFSLLNAFMEELWFRGLFLPRLGPFLGKGLSVLLTALVFAASHLGATYVTPGEILLFLMPVFLLGLGTGWLMVKTESLWGAVLLHAGANVFYALAFTVFSTG